MIRQDFLGKQIHITHATNTSLVDVKGTVVDETKNTLQISCNGDVTTVLKKGITFTVDGVSITGSLITQQPQKRTKLRIKQWQRKKPQRT